MLLISDNLVKNSGFILKLCQLMKERKRRPSIWPVCHCLIIVISDIGPQLQQQHWLSLSPWQQIVMNPAFELWRYPYIHGQNIFTYSLALIFCQVHPYSGNDPKNYTLILLIRGMYLININKMAHNIALKVENRRLQHADTRLNLQLSTSIINCLTLCQPSAGSCQNQS